MGSRLLFGLFLCLSWLGPLSPTEQGPKPVVLQKGEGELRIRRPRENPEVTLRNCEATVAPIDLHTTFQHAGKA